MYGFYNHLDKLRRYGGLQRKELAWLLFLFFALTLIAGFDDGSEVLVFSHWFVNVVIVGIASFFALAIPQFMQRFWALEEGYRFEFTPSWYGILISIFLLVISGGTLLFFGYSGFRLHTLSAHRIGGFRHNLGVFSLAKIASSGPIFNILFAIFVFLLPFSGPLKTQLIQINVVVALSNLLPLPSYDGLKLLFASRRGFSLVFGWCLTTGLLLVFTQLSILILLPLSLLGALLVVFIYFRNVEPLFGSF